MQEILRVFFEQCARGRREPLALPLPAQRRQVDVTLGREIRRRAICVGLHAPAAVMPVDARS
jgi:hypothetical protein